MFKMYLNARLIDLNFSLFYHHDVCAFTNYTINILKIFSLASVDFNYLAIEKISANAALKIFYNDPFFRYLSCIIRDKLPHF